MHCKRLFATVALCGVAAWMLTACRSAPPAAPASPGESVFYTFEKFAPGSMPPTWCESNRAGVADASTAPESASTPSGPREWHVDSVAAAPSGARAFVHDASAEGSASAAWIRDALYGSVKIQVMARCQPKSDFAVLWRVANERNFLGFRVDSKNQTLTIERTDRGVVSTLTKTPFPSPSNQWFALSIEHAGDRIVCGVNGAVLLETTLSDAPPRGSAGFCQYTGSGRVELDNFSVIGERKP